MTTTGRPYWTLAKKTQRGFKGYPIATVAFYGPDDTRASKVAVAIAAAEDADPDPLERWLANEQDIRNDRVIARQVLEFIEQHGAKTVVMTDRIIGCPHEEGIDYPEGQACPQCLFWARRDRWTGKYLE